MSENASAEGNGSLGDRALPEAKAVRRRQSRPRTSPTIADVAREAGVSTASVSRVLNGVQPLSTELIRTVLEARDRLDFRINEVARALRIHSTQTIGVVVPNITYPFFPQLIQALETHLRSEGLGLLLADSLNELSLEAERIRELLDRHVDGLIIAPCQIDSSAVIEEASKRVPVVQLDRLSSQEVPFVGVDQTEAMGQIVAHLRGEGRREFAYIGNTPDNGPAFGRWANYVREMGSHESRERIHLGDSTFEFGKTSAETTLREFPEVDAIICGNDLIALGAIRGAEGMGLAVPDRVAVTGYDDTPYASVSSPTLTTIRQPLIAMATEAVSQLLRRQGSGVTSLPGQLIVRASTQRGRGV